MLKSIFAIPGRIWDAIPSGVQPHVRRFGWSGVLVVFIVVMMMTGMNPVTLFTGQVSPPPPPTSIDPLGSDEPTDLEISAYLDRSFEEMHDIWVTLFVINGLPYEKPSLQVIGAGQTEVCGAARAGVGTFYCPVDRVIYADLEDFRAVRADQGDIADLAHLYLISYSYAQHVQAQLNVFEDYQVLASTGDPNSAAERARDIGRQAHCYVGLWGAVELHERNMSEGAVSAPLARVLRASPALQNGDNFVPKLLEQPSVGDRITWFREGHDLPTPGTCSLSVIAAS